MTSKSLSNLSAKHYTDNKMTNDDDVLANFKKFCKRRPFWCEPVNEKIMEYVAVVPERIIRREKAKMLKQIGTLIDRRIRDNKTDITIFNDWRCNRKWIESEKLQQLLIKEENYYRPPPPPPFKFELGMIVRNSRYCYEKFRLKVVGLTRCFVKFEVQEGNHWFEPGTIVRRRKRCQKRNANMEESRLGLCDERGNLKSKIIDEYVVVGGEWILGISNVI